MAKGTMDRTAADEAVVAFDNAARALDTRWNGRDYRSDRHGYADAEYRARRVEALECLRQHLRQSEQKAGVLAGCRQLPRWLTGVLELLVELSVPLPPADAADSDQVPSTSAEVSVRSLRVLLDLLVPDMPEPLISPNETGGLDFDWHSDDRKIMVGFTVDPDSEQVSAWGCFHGDQDLWSGTIEESKEKFERTMCALAAA
ncbi:MAG TPA: hypothetical protein DEP66_00265 [Acidimicrobiaceae bacterium]|nr:hypothetical protein [Acidimicrobiaceae bacterium]HCB36680.1 hypothetical protein [Acidimicrobiaceae bacterium]